MLDKLSNVGLIGKRQIVTLGEFLDEYIASRSDVKPRTQILYRQAKTALVEFFGADRPLRDITPGDGDAFRLFLSNSGLSENTTRRHIGRAKQFLKAAARRKLIPQNPAPSNHNPAHFPAQHSAAKSRVETTKPPTEPGVMRVRSDCRGSMWRAKVPRRGLERNAGTV